MASSDAPHETSDADSASPRGFSAYTRTLSSSSSASDQPPLAAVARASASADDGRAVAAVHAPLANLEGRVFERLARFRLLPPALKLQSDAAVAYLLAPAVFPAVFSSPSPLHRALGWAHNVWGDRRVSRSTSRNPRVSGARLLRALRRYLQVASGLSGRQDADAAQTLAQTLVLSGLLAPEREKTLQAADPAGDADVPDVVDDYKLLYELVAPGSRRLDGSTAATRPDDGAVSVWDVTDGAIRAGFVFRKPPRRRVLGSSCRTDNSTRNDAGGGRERRVYAVVNGPRCHALVLFRDDVARAQLAFVPLEGATAQYAAPPAKLGRRPPSVYHGVQVWYCTDPSAGPEEARRCETLDFVDKRAQERWLRALLDAGACYKEIHADSSAWAAPTASFYALMASRKTRDELETGADDVLDFSTLRGRVVLVANVPTCESSGKTGGNGADASEQLGYLAALADHFGPDGLAVLVFPCAQFGDCDDRDTDVEREDDSETGEGGEDAEWPPGVEVLPPCDVNGPYAHEVFLFLNARLPGRFGPCVDGDFCKFLVDRHGQPVKRFPPEADARELSRAVCQLLEARNDAA